MSWRAIYDDIPLSESLASVDATAERLFFRMLATCDVWGRGTANPRKLRLLTCPLLELTDQDVERALEQLVEVQRVVVYEVDGERYFEVCGFDTHQPGIRRRGAPRLPDPPYELAVISNKTRFNGHDSGSSTHHSGTALEKSPREGDAEEEGDERKTTAAAADDVAGLAARVIDVLAVVEKPGYAPSKLTIDRVSRLIERAPAGVDVLTEAESLADWERYGAGSRRQTKDGVAALRNWLAKARPRAGHPEIDRTSPGPEPEYVRLGRGESF